MPIRPDRWKRSDAPSRLFGQFRRCRPRRKQERGGQVQKEMQALEAIRASIAQNLGELEGDPWHGHFAMDLRLLEESLSDRAAVIDRLGPPGWSQHDSGLRAT